MFELIAEILLSRFLILIIIVGMLGLVTYWGIQAKAYAGYGLGWLIALFFFALVGTITGGETPDIEGSAPNGVLVAFFGLILGGVGVISGFFSFRVIRMISRSGTRRALTTAILTASLLMILFFLVLVPVYINRLIGILFLAYTIGALTNIVIGQRRQRGEGERDTDEPPPGERQVQMPTQEPVPPEPGQDAPPPPEQMPGENQQPAPADDRWQATRNRLNRLQRRISSQRPELREEDQQGRDPYENINH